MSALCRFLGLKESTEVRRLTGHLARWNFEFETLDSHALHSIPNARRQSARISVVGGLHHGTGEGLPDFFLHRHAVLCRINTQLGFDLIVDVSDGEWAMIALPVRLCV